jgi:hypothetical protein
MKNVFKKIVYKSPTLRSLVQGFLIDRRVADAEQFLRKGGLYPKILPEFMADYRYSISVTYRSVLQVANLEEVVQYIAAKNIPGAFVECGTFTGGASAFALRSILRNEPNREPRPYYGFDSFAGMPQPTVQDGSRAISWMYGKDAEREGTSKAGGELVGSDVNFADYSACLRYLQGTGYPSGKITLVKGWFQDTLPGYRGKIGEIAILRIDGDFYESTKVPLENLFDSVVSGGIVVLDDYGGFSGSQKAVDEFLSARRIDPFLHYVDDSVRFFVKP